MRVGRRRIEVGKVSCKKGGTFHFSLLPKYRIYQLKKYPLVNE